MNNSIKIMNSLGEEEHTVHTLIEWFNINFIKSSKNEFTYFDIEQYIRKGVPPYLCGKPGAIVIEHIDTRDFVKVYRIIDKRTKKFKNEQNKSLRNYRFRNRRRRPKTKSSN